AAAADGGTRPPGGPVEAGRTAPTNMPQDRPADSRNPVEDGSANRSGPPVEDGSADGDEPDETAGPADEPPDGGSEDPGTSPDGSSSQTAADGTTDAGVDASLSPGPASHPDATGDPAPDASSDGADPDETADADDGTVVCRVEGCDRTFETTHGMKIHAAKAHRPDENGGSQPHRDPTRLRAVYEEHDTFEEMRDGLAADVTAQTVRRNMMKFGIHKPDDQPSASHAAAAAATDPDSPQVDAADPSEPESDGNDDGETGDTDRGDDDGETEELGQKDNDGKTEEPSHEDDEAFEIEPADHGDRGTGDVPVDVALPESASLPAGVDVDAIATAASGARTLLEFQRALDVDRETAKRLVDDFDLAAFVTGRLDDGRSETGSERDVVRHIAETVGTRSGGERGDGSGASAD
ncbi:MAG: hypothetical protein V5A23_06395, partial [Halobacteriales archaeon]